MRLDFLEGKVQLLFQYQLETLESTGSLNRLRIRRWGRPNVDITISLSTPWAGNPLRPCIRELRKIHGLAARTVFGELHAI
jgi:hypothetical protein